MRKVTPLPKDLNPSTIVSTYEAGINAFRFNFSHIAAPTADKALKYISDHVPGHVHIIQDLQGHKLRIGEISSEIFMLAYTKFLFVPEGHISKKYSSLPQIPLKFENYEILKDVQRFMMESSRKQVEIKVIDKKIEDDFMYFVCMASENLILRKEKGVTPVGITRGGLTLSKKDQRDIHWGLQNQVDVVLYSFASNANQMLQLQSYINEFKTGPRPRIWAKVESVEGLNNIDEIIAESDGIMIGRGDLLTEVSPTQIPKIQSEIAQKCKMAHKECIIATHVFDNYKNNMKPDLSDVTAMCNAYEYGATGFMLANEFLFAKDPIILAKDFSSVCDKIEEIYKEEIL